MFPTVRVRVLKLKHYDIENCLEIKNSKLKIKKCRSIFQGGDLLRHGALCVYVQSRAEYLYNLLTQIRAAKTARGILSPIQTNSLGFVYA